MIKVNGIEVTKGCTVKFRCGGDAEVAHIEGCDKVYFQGHCWGDSFRYTEDGHIIFGKHKGIGEVTPDFPFDIIEVIPPEFDISELKAGMAFDGHKTHEGKNLRVWYVAPSPIEKGSHIFTTKGHGIWQWEEWELKEMLTRATEEDIT